MKLLLDTQAMRVTMAPAIATFPELRTLWA